MSRGTTAFTLALVCAALALSGCVQNNAPLEHATTPATTQPSAATPPPAAPTPASPAPNATSNSTTTPPASTNATTTATATNASDPPAVNVTTEADYVAGGGVLSPNVPDDCLDTAHELERTSTPIVAQKDQGGVCWKIPNGTRTMAAQANDYVKYDVVATAQFLDAAGKTVGSGAFCTHLNTTKVPAAAQTLIIIVGKGDITGCPPGIGASGPIVVAFR